MILLAMFYQLMLRYIIILNQNYAGKNIPLGIIFLNKMPQLPKNMKLLMNVSIIIIHNHFQLQVLILRLNTIAQKHVNQLLQKGLHH